MTAAAPTPDLSTGQVLHDVVEKATRAPSIHNTQPWRFVAHDNCIELWTDPTRGLDVLDPTGRARHLSCGAALLHARVAADGAGYTATVTVLPDPARPEHLADIRLSRRTGVQEPDRPDQDLLDDAISTRRTAREPFTPGRLADDVIAALYRAAELEGCWLRVADTADDETAIAVLLTRADELQTTDPAYRDELRRWTGQGEAADDGVPPWAVPAADPSRRGTNYRVRDFVADRETAAAVAADEPPPVERPLIAVLGTRGDDVGAWLAAGQGLGRLLLTATSLGVAASPMTQPLEVPDIRTRLGSELGLVGHPQMLLRLGYADSTGSAENAASTPRRPVEDVLTTS